MAGRLVFQPLGASRRVVIALFAAVALFFVYATVAIWRDPNQPTAGQLVWTVMVVVAFGWIGYWYLVRFSLRTTFDGATLGWQTGVRDGSVAVADIVRIRSRLFVLIDIDTTTDRVTLLPAKGYEHLLDALVGARPDLGPLDLRLMALPIRGLRRTRIFSED